jgi:CelD/BcsL family acetyltransferase involved in cellulose biosynthesis
LAAAVLNRIAALPLRPAADATHTRLSPSRSFEPLALPCDRRDRVFATALPQWHSLTASAPPFVAPEFCRLTARLERMRDAWLYGAFSADGLVTALPLARMGRTLVTLRGEHSPRCDLTGDPRGLRALWAALRAGPSWDMLELRGIPADSPLATLLPELARGDGCHVVVRETHRCPWFAAAGIEQRIHRRFRGDMGRLERQLGGVELERIAVADRAVLREVLRLEAAAWKGAAGTAVACDERLVHFYASLARVFGRRGRLTIAFLRARGLRIAGLFALEDATTFYLLKTGYDPEFAHFGPGQLLVRETAADAVRRGLTRYDLMGKESAWKSKWTDQARAHVEVLVYAPTARGRMHHWVREVARPFAGRALRALRGTASPPTRPDGHDGSGVAPTSPS